MFNALIFCPYSNENLIFKNPDELYEIKFNPSIETNKNNFVMIIFDVNMYHEVEPIISGTRFVFKKQLFVKNKINVKVEEVNDLCDGKGGFYGSTGDY
jgi:hypothetical protein